MFANWFCQFPSVPLVQCVDSLKYNMLCCFLDIVNQAMIVIAALTSSWNVRLPHHSNFTHLQSPLATPIKLDSSSVTPAACNHCRGDLKESAVLAWNLWIVSRPEASLNTNVVPSPNIAMSERLLFRFWICARLLTFSLAIWRDACCCILDAKVPAGFFIFCDALLPAAFFITFDALMSQMFTMIPHTSWWPKVHIAMVTIATYM